MKTSEVKEMMLCICEKEIESKDELCKLDSFVGDGDHGYTVERGFKAVKEAIADKEYNSPKEVLEEVGDVLAESMGGAIGMIIGSLFTGGSFGLEEKDEINESEFAAVLNDGLEEIKMVGGAKEGDRTLIDSLSPAAHAFDEAEKAGKDMMECFRAAAEGARNGSEATKEMVAKKGRAKFLQDKSKGYVDAGSVTMALIIESMRDYVESLQ